MLKQKARRLNKPAFEWTSPSPKQEQILYWWTPPSPYKDYAYFQAEGSVRCGKTVLADFSFVNWASYTYDQEEFALCSKTIGTAIRNQVRPLMKVLSVEPSYQLQFRRGREEGSHLTIYNADTDHENVFWIYGGKDEASQDLIQGKTLAGILFDEPPLMPQSFINQGLARLSVEGAKAWFLNNPENPNHPLYTETTDPLTRDGKLYFLHLVMDDNPSLSEEAKNRIKSQWPAGSVYYKRYVLGRRAAAEGRVFPFFDEDPSAGYVVTEIPGSFTMYLLGIDYGISNPFVAQLWGLSGGVWYCIKDFEWDSLKRQKQKTNPEYIEDLARLCYVEDHRIAPDQVIIPPEEPGFQRELIQCAYPELHRARDADNAILPGIEDLTTLLSLGRFKVFHECESTIYGLANLLWDEKKQKQGIDMFLKGGSGSPDHAADCSRYIGRRAKYVLARMGLI